MLSLLLLVVASFAHAQQPAPSPTPCTYLMTLDGECVCPSSTFGADGCVDTPEPAPAPFPDTPEPEPEPAATARAPAPANNAATAAGRRAIVVTVGAVVINCL